MYLSQIYLQFIIQVLEGMFIDWLKAVINKQVLEIALTALIDFVLAFAEHVILLFTTVKGR